MNTDGHYFSTLSSAVIVAGRPATGKSAALSTVVSALNFSGLVDSEVSTSSNVRLLRIYPGVFEELSAVFGRVCPTSGDWVDGVFTTIFRKAHKVCVSSYSTTTLNLIHSFQ